MIVEKKTRERHGMKHTRVYMCWENLRSRCANKNKHNYHRYGGRGIKVCGEWSKFTQFYKDMGSPADGMTLDRIDNNKGYSKDNCRWVTASENSRNRSTSKLDTDDVAIIKCYLKYNVMTMADIARTFNVARPTISKINKELIWSDVACLAV